MSDVAALDDGPQVSETVYTSPEWDPMARKLTHFVAAALAVVLVAGCVSSEVADSWRGESVDRLIMSWGAPARDYQLPNGGREISYTHERLVQGTSYYCAARFQTDAVGVVVFSAVEGNIGGCNVLLGGKAAAR